MYLNTKIIEEGLNSCLLMFELLGLQYFSLLHDNLKDRPTKFRTAFFVSIILLITLLLTYRILFSDFGREEHLKANNVLTYAMEHSLGLGVILVVYTNLIQSYATTVKVKKLFINTKVISQISYETFNVFVDFKHIRNLVLRQMSIMFAFVFTLHFSVSFLMMKSLEHLVLLALLMFPLLFFLMIVYKYIYYVSTVNHQLLMLHRLLESLFANERIEDVNSTTSLTVNCSKDNYFKKFQACRKIYNLILDNGKLVNETNGLYIILTNRFYFR